MGCLVGAPHSESYRLLGQRSGGSRNQTPLGAPRLKNLRGPGGCGANVAGVGRRQTGGGDGGKGGRSEPLEVGPNSAEVKVQRLRESDVAVKTAGLLEVGPSGCGNREGPRQCIAALPRLDD
ncbi:hypothetical protein NDU88_002539 [Pleurodeles waltl]|uniref:Uncharacterized protein n=1 Tax=Pleurodeles waltl TaxID=8319 RepID=A0AAV7REU2_PLEWA|nr:hypothetical protein NDU88_002539 [Pleurodeles waltl]